MIQKLKNFLKSLISHIVSAINSPYPKWADKLEVYKVLNNLYFKSKIFPGKNQAVSQNIFGYKVTAYDYNIMLYLFKEIFLNKEYAFHCKKEQPIILDCGANIGMSVIYFKTRYPNCSILAFEPNPFAFKLLKQNVVQNSLENVRIENVGLSNESGTIDFYLSEDKGSVVGSLLKDRGGDNVVKVEVRKLSSYIMNQQFDLAKIDIEGAENAVLEDLIETDTIDNFQNFRIEYHHRINQRKSELSSFLVPFELMGYEYNIRTSFEEEGEFQDILLSIYKEGNDMKKEKVKEKVVLRERSL